MKTTRWTDAALADFGRRVLWTLSDTGFDAEVRLSALVWRAERMGFGTRNEDAEEDTDPWLLIPDEEAPAEQEARDAT